MNEALAAAFEAIIRQVVRDELAARATPGPREPSRPTSTELWISVAEAARRRSVRPSTIREWITRNKLPATQIAGTRGYRILLSDWLAFCDGRTGQVPATATERGQRIARSIEARR